MTLSVLPQVHPSQEPQFKDCSVHDPSVLKVNGTFWIVGSHLSLARSDNLLQWTQISSGVRDGNPLFPNLREQLAETFSWSTRFGLWAACLVQLDDGRFYLYYCSCEGRSPLSALGVAVSDKVDGPYQNLKVLLKSGKGTSEDGTPYDVDRHPNAIDPHTFFDAQHNLWMVYGSWSGGIFILKMDPRTGFQFPNQGYGKKLMGGRCRVEGAFIQYSPHTKYYYLFTSFGELSSRGGYNIRVARSRSPDGPYFDPQGNDMVRCIGRSISDPAAIEPFGGKLLGNFRFLDTDGQPTGSAYVSPGHNSTCYDPKTDKYFIIFHTRFPGRAQGFLVRVHQMFLNSDRWFVVAPHRYAGESIAPFDANALSGTYSLLKHTLEISAAVKDSVLVRLNDDHTITGSVTGGWEQTGQHSIRLTIDGGVYNGVALTQWDQGLRKWVTAISALASDGTSIWASRLSPTPAETAPESEAIHR